jgi:iron complex outermembrane receptor protein
MLALNLYDMEYHNQLIPTGKLNEVGYKLMSNVPYSYRRGMELSADIRPFSVLQLDANLSLSTNKVKDFSLYYSTYDNASDWNEILDQSRQISSYYSMADLPFSPACIAAARLQYQPVPSLQLSLMGKYIAEQQFSYIQHEEFRLPAYTQFNFSAVYSGCLVGNSDFELGFYINNLLGNQPLCNAWGYEVAFLSGEEPYRETGYYILAPRHYMLKFVFKI